MEILFIVLGWADLLYMYIGVFGEYVQTTPTHNRSMNARDIARVHLVHAPVRVTVIQCHTLYTEYQVR